MASFYKGGTAIQDLRAFLPEKQSSTLAGNTN